MTLLTDEVILGENDYLFLYSGGQSQFSFLTAELSPEDGSVNNFVTNIEARKIYCSEREIEYLHVVFPSKPVVKKKFLPLPYKNSVSSLFVNKYLSGFNNSLPNYVLYPLEELLSKDNESIEDNVYRVRDTHMTDYGYFVVVESILNKLNLSYDFHAHMKYVNQNMISDLSLMCGDSKKYTERNIQYVGGPVSLSCNRKFLKGNTGNISFYHNLNIKNGRNLLIFGDSFLRESLKFFIPLFENILYIRSSGFQKDIIDLFDPDVIITGNAERYLSHVESDIDSSSILFYFDDKEWYKPDLVFKSAFKAQLSRKNYPVIYEKWSKSLKNNEIIFHGVGHGVLNPQIQLIDIKSFKMRSIGADPYIEVLGVPFDLGVFYKIEISIISSVTSTVVIYYLDREFNDSYTEDFTVRQNINIGENFLVFDIHSSNLLPRFRIDPMATKGDFMIRSLKIVPST